MWIVSWLRPNIPKWYKSYFVRKSEAERFYKRQSYNRGMEVKIWYDDSYELQNWEKEHRDG